MSTAPATIVATEPDHGLAPLDGACVMVVDNGTLSLGQLRGRLEALGASTEVVRAAAVPASVPSSVDAIVLSGTKVRAYDQDFYGPLVDLVGNADVPVLGICGGMQLIMIGYGAVLSPGEQRVGSHWADVDISEPIFAYVGDRVRLFHRHTLYVRQAPAGFRVIGSSPSAPVELIRSDDSRIFGSQAHLEFGPDGRNILRGFADIVASRR
jgi:GMP synthase (glutamine-hydrolysing)